MLSASVVSSTHSETLHGCCNGACKAHCVIYAGIQELFVAVILLLFIYLEDIHFPCMKDEIVLMNCFT